MSLKERTELYGDREGEGLEYHVSEHEEEGLGFGKEWRLTANSDSELF